jgi:arsenite methyltransferase
VVLRGAIPDPLRASAEMYAGCVSGALQESEYLGIIHDLGFEQVSVQKRKPIIVPDDILSRHLSSEEIAAYKASGTGIFSITVSASKPASDPDQAHSDKSSLKAACCGTNSTCC